MLLSPGRIGRLGGLSKRPVRFRWFVDSVNGNDANSGRSVSAAFKTWAAVAAVWGAGQAVGIVAGSDLREQAVFVASGQSIGKAGVGADPIFRAANVAPNANFSAATQPNVHKITWVHNVTPAATTFLSVWEDGVKLIRVASEAACSALAGSFWVNGAVASSTSTVMVHPKGNTNPTSDGKVYEITARDYCVKSTYSNSVVEDLVGIGCGHNDGVIVVEDGVINRCEGYDGQKHIFFLANGRGIDLVAVGVEDNSTVYVAYDGDPTSNNVTWLRCYADGALPDASIPVQGVTGFYAHSANFGVLYQSITLIDCEAIRCSVGHSQDAALVTSIRFKTRDCLTSIRCGVSGGATGAAIVREPYLDGRGSISGWDGPRVLEFNLQTARLEGGVIFIQERQNDRIAIYCGTTCDLDVVNPTLIGSDTRPAYGIYRNGAGLLRPDRIIFKGISYPYYGNAGGLVGMTPSNNVYHRSSGAITWNDASGSTTSFAAWQALGYDKDSINADPLFTNASSTWTQIADAAITAPSAVNLMAGATYYGVPRIVPQITSLSFSGGAVAGLKQTPSYTGTGTPGLVASYEWLLNGVVVSTSASYTSVAGTLALRLTLANEGGSVTSTTAAQTISPSVSTLDVNFASNTATQEGVTYADVAAWLAAKATFVRNQAGNYYADLAGALTTRSANVARYGDAGLLYEPSRTNVMLRSQELGATGYADFSSGTTTVTADNAAAPDGTTTADKLAGNNGNTWWGRSLASNPSGYASKTYANSVWAKADASFVGEQILSFQSNGTRQRVNRTFTTSLARHSQIATFLPGDTGLVLQPTINHGNAHQLWAWGWQIEEVPAGQLAQATSYIPTTTAAVTRPADQLTFNLPAGTHYVLLTFDNDNQQVIPNVASNYTLTNSLDRYLIKRLQVLSAA